MRGTMRGHVPAYWTMRGIMRGLPRGAWSSMTLQMRYSNIMRGHPACSLDYARDYARPLCLHLALCAGLCAAALPQFRTMRGIMRGHPACILEYAGDYARPPYLQLRLCACAACPWGLATDEPANGRLKHYAQPSRLHFGLCAGLCAVHFLGSGTMRGPSAVRKH
jgi:hypothetical protein